ncbi:hypothetical protein [Ottowia testudinis]|uniref:Uncharacterized protein n=1 Tax=Ottowia testudinis TaxID=2816950 RepID=A0A975H2M6_9BURK|nr:hypothetical protein [Ottowia testudinis]QTD44355.1 hypothetical protein J1M35_14735 [Ottowia testudinis]
MNAYSTVLALALVLNAAASVLLPLLYAQSARRAALMAPASLHALEESV